MKKLYLGLLTLCLGGCLFAQDTFSIVAADPETGEIGAAAATCVDGIAAFGGIQLLNQIIPGRGGVNAQAYVCINPHANLELAIEQMEAGLNPEEIIEYLINNDACFSQNFNPEYRQYGIVDFDEQGNVRTAGFTGMNTDDYKEHRTGPTYAIQGNILLGPEVIDGMENGFNNTEGSLAQKLMGAMQGANIAGADVRCLDRGTSSTSAFLRVVRPEDDVDDPYLELNVLEMPFGEEPIDSLQNLFDAWELVNDVRDPVSAATVIVFPNPSADGIQVRATTPIVSISAFNTYGKTLPTGELTVGESVVLATTAWPTGTYYLRIRLLDGTTVMRKMVKQ